MRGCFATVFLLAAVAACGGSGSGSPAGNICSKAIAKVDSCGFHNLAKTQCEESNDPLVICLNNCALDKPCEAFVASYCHGDSSGFQDCIAKCEPPDFLCGSGEQVPTSYQCDGYDDCSDGSDEQNCVLLDCGDGSTYTQPEKCNGFPSCFNGADEAGCPGSTTCSDGTTVGEFNKCDTYPDCPEGEDEAGCVFITCDDGIQYTEDAKCDGIPHCDDGTDELGCGGSSMSADEAITLDCQTLP